MNNGIREGISKLTRNGLCGGIEAVLSCATEFHLGHNVKVSYRQATNNWTVVIQGAWVLNDQNRKEWEPSPSNRDEAFIASTRFDFATAWEKATKAAIRLQQEEEQFKQERKERLAFISSSE